MTAHRMAAVDAAWLHMDRPVNQLVVHAVLWFDRPLDDDLVREAVAERLVAQHPRFAQRVDDGGAAAWWVDVPAFDPMAHVTRERLAAPGDLTALTRVVSRLASTPLPRDRPLWQLHLVDGFEGGTALVARMHHCIADGIALFRVLLSLSDEAQDGRLGALQPAGADLPARRGGAAALGTAGRVAAALAALVGMLPDRRTPLRAALGTAKSVRWAEPIPLDALKAAARAAGATVNDLVLAALSGALGRSMTDAVPRDVRAVLPVNLRPLDRADVELGNRFGLVFLRLPVRAARADRMAAVHRRTDKLKRAATAPVTLGILRVAGHAHRRVVKILIDIFSAKGSLVVTNVPGPQQTLHLGGVAVRGVVAWPPQSGSIGLAASIISYAGRVVIGVMNDDRVGIDADRLLADLRAELVALGADLGDPRPGELSRPQAGSPR